MEVFVGIDVGTQSTKGIAYLPTDPGGKNVGRILARASASYDLLPTDVPGRAEQDPNDWIVAVRTVLRKLVSDLGLGPLSMSSSSHALDVYGPHKKYVLSGIGISGQQHGMVLLDEQYHPVRPAKLWCDVEAAEEARWIRTEGAKIIGAEGKWDHVLPAFTAPKVLWTIRNEPEVWKKVRWCMLPHDYVNLRIRGAYDPERGGTMTVNTDRGDASGSGVFDPIANDYCMELVNAIDPTGRYAQSLPKILEPLDVCGSLSLQYMRDVGLLDDASRADLSRIPYIRISVGSGDNMCSALGVGCVRPGMAVLSLGTSGTIFGVSHSPPSSKVSPFADACGRYLPLSCVMSCTGVLNSVLDSFFNGCKPESDEDSKERWSHADATQLAMQHPPGCYGITFLPYLTPGERTPDWPDASGAILGLTASNMSLAVSNPRTSLGIDKPPANPMAGLIYRAAMEGITYLLAEALATMKDSCGDGFRPSSLLVVGGGSHNQLWRQMLADVLQMELRFPREKESAALGAAFQVGAAADSARRMEKAKHRVRTLKCKPRESTIVEYVLKQSIDMEEEVVTPTTEEKTLQLYWEGREKYCKLSARLFGEADARIRNGEAYRNGV